MRSPRENPGAERVLTIRNLRPDDLSTALRIQSENYPAFLVENEVAFASRLHIDASYCLAAELNDVVVGYLLAHGWAAQSPPPIGIQPPRTVLTEVLFIHDLSISVDGRGLGLGRKLVSRACELARADGLKVVELIAVQGADRYWRSLGFSETVTFPSLRTKVAAYGVDARFMTRSIA